jgi:hypothetical protein
VDAVTIAQHLPADVIFDERLREQLLIAGRRIVVQLDGTNSTAISFSPRTYRSFDYANASTIHKAQGASVDATVSVIDRSASAELLFVAASRSKLELDIIIPRTAFHDLDDLAKHVAEGISLKTTTQTFREIMERTGGVETIRVHNIEAQRQAAPLRRLYEADVIEPLRVVQEKRIDCARRAYEERKREIARSALSIDAKLDGRRKALRLMRRAIANTYREIKPQVFGEWLQEREELRARSCRPSPGQAHRWRQAHERTDRPFTHAEQAARDVGHRIEHQRL